MSGTTSWLARVVLGVVVLAACALATIDIFTFLTVSISCSVGAFLIARRPRNAVGWLVFAIGLTNLATTTRPDLDVDGLVAGTASWPHFLSVWVGAGSGGLGFVCYAAVAFVFPSGTLVQRRRRGIQIALVAAALVALVPPALSPSLPITTPDGTEVYIPNVLSPFGTDTSVRPPPLGVVISTMLPLLVLAAGVVDLLRRFRQAIGVERLQMRWLLTSVGFVVVSLFLGVLLNAIVGPSLGIIAWLPALFASPTVALAIGVAILRYRLYDIDRIVSRTIGWALVTATLLGVFAVLVIGLQALLVGVTQTEEPQTVVVAASTLAALALFQPVRRRIQNAVDRRFDRARYDGERTAAAFADRLRVQVDLDSLADDLTATVGAAVRPTSATIWLANADRSPTASP